VGAGTERRASVGAQSLGEEEPLVARDALAEALGQTPAVTP
jgi:hypothetical protein